MHLLGALFGGAITSILFNIPGEPWSVATTFDGYPMAQQGRADEALTGAFTSSFIGALVAVIVITFLAPVVARFALRFGPAEFFAVQFLTFASFIGMGHGSPFKTLASMCLGFALASVGLDTVTGQLRMTFGVTDLLTGFKFLTAVIGLFGLGEILASMESGLAFSGTHARLRMDAVLETWKKLPAGLDDVAAELRDWLLDGHHTWRGDTGVVHELRSGKAVRQTRRAHRDRRARRRHCRGNGRARRRDGRAFADAHARHSGIADCRCAARRPVDLGPSAGPLLFVEQKEFVWGLIASMYLGNLAGLIIVLSCVPLFAAILRVPFSIIAPTIMVVCAVGAYTINNAMFDVWLVLVFGAMGYVFNKLSYPLAPLVLALVLGDMAESSFRQAMLLSQGSLSIFWSNALVGSIVSLGLILLCWPFITWAFARPWTAKPAFR